MRTRIPFFIGIAILCAFGFVSSSVVAAKKTMRTIAVYAQYPLASDRWYLNNTTDGDGQLVVVGRGFCRKISRGEWKITLRRADGTSGEALVRTGFSFTYPFPFVGINVSVPDGFNAGVHVEEVSSSTPHLTEFSCM